MSAIVGIYNLNQQPVDRHDVEQMIDRLVHRGKDGVGLWCEGAVGLGHRLLWTTMESKLEQFPLISDRLILTADARIDNREELIEKLNLSTMDIPITDSQLILAAYGQWGDRCPEYLLGDFAFAIWDQTQQQLFCARDHFGVKPFYYYLSDKIFVFATEIKALFCLRAVPRQLNTARIVEHLDSSDSDLDTTFYQGILRLPPARRLTIGSGEIKLDAYWSLDPTRELNLNDEAAAAQFLSLFTEAVRCRLRTAYPLGSMLSGGLDSSSITCVARQLLASEDMPLHTFSARFDQVPVSDERTYQEAVLQQGNLHPHFFPADQYGPLADCERMVRYQDEPIDAGNLYINWGLYDTARTAQVRVILDGFDGDTTVSHGYEYLRELAQSGKWITLWQETKAYGERFNLPWKKVFWNWVWRYGVKSKLKPLRQVFKPANYESSSENAIAPPRTERENHYRLLIRNDMPRILEILDRSAGAFAVELRFPFFDKRLVEFCLALPPEHKLHQGWSRIVIRRAMAQVLPELVQWRVDKSNLHPSFEYGLRTFGQQQIEDAIFNNSHLIQDYVDIATLQQIYQRLVAETATETDVNLLWRTITLSLWLRAQASFNFSPVAQEVMPAKH